MRGSRKHPALLMRLLSTGIVLLLCASLARPTSALDLESRFEFRIAPQKLATALVELSRQADAPVVSDTRELDRFDSEGISGRMSLRHALSALLKGTDLDYRVTDQGVIAVGVFVGRPQHPAADASEPRHE